MSSILNWCAVSTSKISDKSNNFLLNHSYFFWGLISIGTPTQCSTWSQIAKISWQDHVRNTDCFLVGVRVRVLKISTRVGLEYTAGLEYYITVFQCVQLWFIDWLIDVSCIGLNCWVANFLIKRFFLYRYLYSFYWIWHSILTVSAFVTVAGTESTRTTHSLYERRASYGMCTMACTRPVT